ncbi:class I SAM-dependent methyltransferase [Streptomyces minutiscleroticus]|uniref:Methyltransferase n=1 Tax=Streptomyces minutiscleroticus TaxID=68238 RepID=A0A918U5U1_9ACTN|nr:methyltransferase domain-containing protein [Streptomyces minutiscleroticus]GGX96548.1 methyltransferase [Streptomyces minutiscleroticus]
MQPLAPASRYCFENDPALLGAQHRCLAAAYDPITLPRLAAAGVTAGWRCLDAGSGGGSVARWLAARVGPTGHVLATDLVPPAPPPSPHPRLTVAAHDIRHDPLPEAAFDLIVARLLLQHLPERLEVLDRLVRALAPGGLLQVDELDTSYEPPLLTPDGRAARLYTKFLAARSAVFRAAGGDPHWGRHAPAALRAAGLTDLDPQPHILLRSAGSAVLELQVHHTHHLREQLIAAGMTEDELHRVRSLMRHPSFCAASSVLYSVQGRRPRADEAP